MLSRCITLWLNIELVAEADVVAVVFVSTLLVPGDRLMVYFGLLYYLAVYII